MTDQKRYLSRHLLIILLIFASDSLLGCKTKKEEARNVTQIEKLPDIKERLAKYAPTEIAFDENLLDEENKKVLRKLILAAGYMDKIFWRQASPRGLALEKELEESPFPADKDYLRFLKINFGPFDRQDENRPFLGSSQKPLGAGFYPPDLSKEEFSDFVTRHPEMKETLESPYTVIKRKGQKLVAVPYNEEYKEDLEPAAKALREASELTSNPSLKKYLSQRAKDLLSNNYYESDCLWIDLKDNLVEIVIGPYEVYEDNLNGLKAAYESFVYINDLEEMKKIKDYLDYIDAMQQNLPVQQKYKEQKARNLASPLNVVLEVFTAGDAKAGIQTSAFVLPNDEKVREEKGTKKVFLKNVMEAKFKKCLLPISERVLSAQDASLVTFYAYFNEVILHEISHALGTNYATLPDGTRMTVNKALKEHFSPLEEAKAYIVGLSNIRLLMDKRLLAREAEKQIYTTFLAGIFRSLRFGFGEAHGLATLIEFNFLREKGAFVFDPERQKFKVNWNKVEGAVQDLAKELLILEGKGSYEDAAQFISRYGQPDELISKTIKKLSDIPVDIEPLFTFK